MIEYRLDYLLGLATFSPGRLQNVIGYGRGATPLTTHSPTLSNIWGMSPFAIRFRHISIQRLCFCIRKVESPATCRIRKVLNVRRGKRRSCWTVRAD